MPKGAGSRIDTEALTQGEYQAIRSFLGRPWVECYDLLWETGVRINEALVLTKADLVDGGVWIEREKRKDNRRDFIPVAPWLMAELHGLTIGTGRQHLFAKRKTEKPYTVQAAWAALRVAARAASIRIGPNGESTIHPHLYRHGFGVRASRAKMGMESYAQKQLVAKMLGHTGTKDVDRYSAPGHEDVQDGFRKLFGG